VLESAQAATGGEQDLLDRIARYFAIATEDLSALAQPALQRRPGSGRGGAPEARLQPATDRSHPSGRDKSTVSTLASRGRAMIEEQDILRHLLAG
jgi:hypothetical protein